MGPQELLDRAEVKNKWQLTPLKNFKSPRLTERMWRTALVVLVTSIIYKYPLDGRNPCFALIGAVYGVGSQFEEGFHNGINRVIGTLVGGLLVIPFHRLYTSQPFGIPDWIWLVTGLCLVLWCNLHWVQILQFSLESSFISLLCLQSEKKGFFYTQSQEPYHEGKRT